MSLVKTADMLYNAKMKRADSGQIHGEVGKIVAGGGACQGRQHKEPAAAKQCPVLS